MEAVKAAYAKTQDSIEARQHARAVGVIDLAEAIAGQSFWAEGVPRQQAARKVLDWPQLERTVAALVQDGWLRQVSAADARAMRLGGTYGMTPSGRYYIAEADFRAAFAAQERGRRNEHRARLLAAAQAEVLAVYDGEVQRRYQVACQAVGLAPTEPEA